MCYYFYKQILSLNNRVISTNKQNSRVTSMWKTIYVFISIIYKLSYIFLLILKSVHSSFIVLMKWYLFEFIAKNDRCFKYCDRDGYRWICIIKSNIRSKCNSNAFKYKKRTCNWNEMERLLDDLIFK